MITGKNLVRNETKANQLFLYSVESNTDGSFRCLDFKKRILVKEIDKFDKVCTQYFFEEPEGMPDSAERTHMIFVSKFEIFRLNLQDETLDQLFEFVPPLVQQPSYFFPNTAQDTFVIGSAVDVKILF